MSTSYRIAVTADLHWGSRHPAGNVSTESLIRDLEREPVDLLILAGDIGAGEQFDRCLELFEHLPGRKALVPGNHDVWVTSDDARGDSAEVYHEYLPRRSAEHGFLYLDQQPLILPEVDLAIVGSMNWYDYSWGIDRLPGMTADWESRLQNKRFTLGMHNDANFVRWPWTDPEFTQSAVRVLGQQLRTALGSVTRTIVVTHHPAFRGLNYPKPDPPSIDAVLWDAFSGNSALEDILREYAERVPFVFSGHTHYARENRLGPIQGHNIGGDYHFKRLHRLNWPEGTIEARAFYPDDKAE